jgi:predicted Fe-S protein YdhL (DUF1289 family)
MNETTLKETRRLLKLWNEMPEEQRDEVIRNLETRELVRQSIRPLILPDRTEENT